MIDTIQPLAAIVDECPNLGPEGLGSPTPEERALLLAEGEAYRRCVRWIQATLQPARRLNTRHSAYGLKHLFERCTGVYVTTGGFVAAMLAAGYRATDDPSPCFWLNERSVERAMRAAGWVGWHGMPHAEYRDLVKR